MSEEKFKRFLAQHNRGLKILSALFVAVMGALIAYYGFTTYRSYHERALAKQINDLQIEYEAFSIASAEGGEREKMEKMANFSSDFYNLYAQNPRSKGGARSLFFSASILLEMDFTRRLQASTGDGDGENSSADAQNISSVNEQAKEYLTIVADSSSPLAAQAVYLLAYLHEEAVVHGADVRLYDEALAYLDALDENYPSSFLQGEAVLMRARILMAKENFFQAYALMQKALEDDFLSSYREKFNVQISYLESLGFASSELPGETND